jgi:tRNA-dihydrouridine synthase A
MTSRAKPISVSIAPMMDRTDRHYRYLMRRITRHTLLYTEMVNIGALLHGERARFLTFHPDEHPIALQLGGDDPSGLATCARMAEEHGFDEVNLNVGCPSSRVQSGNFGACLMRTPERVADAVSAMRNVTSIPVTVKHRIGVDELDRYEDMLHFVDVVAEAGCDRFSVHARKAWLNGLSPKENRNVPPLRYDDVYRLKRQRPALLVELNGGVTTLDEVETHCDQTDGVMIGRAAYDNPWLFSQVDERFFGEIGPAKDRVGVLREMLPYVRDHLASGQRLHRVSRHLLGLFQGERGTKAFKRVLSSSPGGGVEVIETAIDAMEAVAHRQAG